MKDKEAKNNEIDKKLSIQQEQINNKIINRTNKLSKISKIINFDIKQLNKEEIRTYKKNYQSYGQLINDNKELYEDKIIRMKKFYSWDTTLLMSFYVYILHELSNNQIINDFINFYRNFIKYKNEMIKFIENNNYNKQHNHLLILLNNALIKNIKLNIICINTKSLSIFNKENIKCYDLSSFNFIRNEIKQIMPTFLDMNSKILNTIETINYIQNKDKKIEIINTFYNKMIKSFDVYCNHNNPEITIFNNLVNFSKTSENIIYLMIQFVLPVSYIKPLKADFFIVLNINNRFHFCIIEYDGPTHYNITDFRITVDHIKRDIIKNKFCVNNNISIIWVLDKDKNYVNTIINFIHSVISNNGEPIFKIPDDEYYKNLLEDLTNYTPSDKKSDKKSLSLIDYF